MGYVHMCCQLVVLRGLSIARTVCVRARDELTFVARAGVGADGRWLPSGCKCANVQMCKCANVQTIAQAAHVCRSAGGADRTRLDPHAPDADRVPLIGRSPHAVRHRCGIVTAPSLPLSLTPLLGFMVH
jgi:hypothetical protein